MTRSILTGLVRLSVLLPAIPLAAVAQTPVAHTLTEATSISNHYISWREHIIDDPTIAGFSLNGSDGLVMADIDRDGYEDVISVHEFDSSFDSARFEPGFVGVADGHVRIAYGSADPNSWTNYTLAEGSDAPAPEDVDIADLNGDGWLDVIVAAELSHLIYLQNPANGNREQPWQRLILPMTANTGSYIRVFLADLDGDGRPEAMAPNKGAQTPGPDDYARSTPVSIFKVSGDPLDGNSWKEIELGRYSIPQNSEPVDLDGDGDLDIVIGTRGENRLAWFENPGDGSLDFIEHAIGINGGVASGFNLEYADLNGDNRLDIIGRVSGRVGWLEQPANIDDAWNAHYIGSMAPDSVTGLEITDIDGDNRLDIMVGSYSRGDRENDSNVSVSDPLGRIAWFQQPELATDTWTRHDITRRKRGMFDKFIARDLDQDGDLDFVGTRGNSFPYDGVFWLEQVRSDSPSQRFQPARNQDSEEMPLPPD